MKARSTSKKTLRVKAAGRGSRSAASTAASGDRNGVAPAAGVPGRRGKSLAAVNAWLSANEKRVLKAAARNCAKLTGKPRF